MWFVVCSGWCFQGWAEWVFYTWVGWRWLQWRRGARYANTYGNHHPCNSHTERAGRERTSHPRADVCRAEAIQLSRRHCWVICRESWNAGSQCYCPSWILTLQADWRACCTTVCYAVSFFMLLLCMCDKGIARIFMLVLFFRKHIPTAGEGERSFSFRTFFSFL